MSTQPPSGHDASPPGLLGTLKAWWRRRAETDEASVLSSLPGVTPSLLQDSAQNPPSGLGSLPSPTLSADLPRWATESELAGSRPTGAVSDSERAALKAMIERKRRNDFVRKREFDLLRRARREGLSLEQLHALGASSRLDDEDSPDEPVSNDPLVRDKIRVLEEQMVGPAPAARPFNPILRGTPPETPGAPDRPGTTDAPTLHATTPPPESSPVSPTARARPLGEAGLLSDSVLSTHLQRDYNPETVPGQISHFDPRVDGLRVERRLMASGESLWADPAGAMASPGSLLADDPPGQGPPSVATALAPPPDQPLPQGWMHSENHWIDATERADPRLDEVVQAFSQGRLEAVERQLSGLTQMLSQPGRDDGLWQAWLDFLQVTHQRRRFEGQAQQYALNFSRPVPDWQDEGLPGGESEILSRFLAPTHVDWSCPAVLTGADMAALDPRSSDWGSWVVLDWSALTDLDLEAATSLARLVRLWINRSLDMRWLGGERLLALIVQQVEASPVTQGFAWRQLRAAVLNLLDRRDPFEDALSAYAREREGHDLPDLRSWTVPMARVALISQEDLDSARRGGPALRGALRGPLTESLARLQPPGTGPWLVDASGVVWIDAAAARSLCDWARRQHAAGSPVQLQGINRLAAFFLQANGLHEVAYMQLRKI
ncbi:STAS domain-containing protein [Amphibiibacter pelophylacis]|uniref:STAS domain-containing protein n=1 Tax=Amphibiibacter pelophylacis TaxID=1799477 RepID=A0ACC6P589_9BURK